MNENTPSAGELRDTLGSLLAAADPEMVESRRFLQAVLHGINESGSSSFATEEMIVDLVATVSKLERELLTLRRT